MEILWKSTVSESAILPETTQKLCLSTKFPHQENVTNSSNDLHKEYFILVGNGLESEGNPSWKKFSKLSYVLYYQYYENISKLRKWLISSKDGNVNELKGAIYMIL